MLYKSTRGSEKVTSLRAVLNGLAPDGGLYVPVIFPDNLNWRSVMGLSFKEMACHIFSCFLDDFDGLSDIVDRSYSGKFSNPDITPLAAVGDRYVLELFYGPTCAFKDIALSVLPQLLSAAKIKEGVSDDILILTATSGDTGTAAMEGFRDVPGLRMLVFYPYKGVSPVQERQMTTQEGGNICAAAVYGNFDDAQSAVKTIFANTANKGLPDDLHTILSSANSINIGRLVPQIVYYFKAYSDLLDIGRISLGDLVDFTVPTGNFGDILAGAFAKKLGLPIRRLICASNANNVLTDFLTSGQYNKNRPFYKTLSPSMDILVSSNLERLLYMTLGDAAVKHLMEELAATGGYCIPQDALADIRQTFAAGYATDKDALEAIARVWNNHHYLMDPHTAVAWSVADRLETGRPDGVLNVILSTASPYKFPQAVLTALKQQLPRDPFEMITALYDLCEIPVPGGLAGLFEKPVRFFDAVRKDEMYRYMLDYLAQ